MKVKVCVTGSLLQCPAGLGPLPECSVLPSSAGCHWKCQAHPSPLGLVTAHSVSSTQRHSPQINSTAFFIFSSVDLKQISCQLFLQQSWIVDWERIAVGGGQWSAPVVRHVRAPSGKRDLLRGIGSWEQGAHGFSLAVSLPAEESCLLPVGFCYLLRPWELPHSGPPSLFSWGFC